MRDNSSGQAEGDDVKRLRCIVWSGLAIVSALLCAATAAIWIRSGSRADAPAVMRNDWAMWFLSARGDIAVLYIDTSPAPGSKLIRVPAKQGHYPDNLRLLHFAPGYSGEFKIMGVNWAWKAP